MPLRRAESHSETISALSQYETLDRPPEALKLAYSASEPPHDERARQIETGHTMQSARTAPSARVVTSPGVAILTVITRQKSHHERSNFDTEEIGRYRARGGGRGCDPAHVYAAYEHLGFPAGNQCYSVVNEPGSGPVGPYLLTSFL